MKSERKLAELGQDSNSISRRKYRKEDEVVNINGLEIMKIDRHAEGILKLFNLLWMDECAGWFVYRVSIAGQLYTFKGLYMYMCMYII